jgi:hypothetical protein
MFGIGGVPGRVAVTLAVTATSLVGDVGVQPVTVGTLNFSVADAENAVLLTPYPACVVLLVLANGAAWAEKAGRPRPRTKVAAPARAGIVVRGFI